MGEDVSTVTRLQEYQFRLRINEEEAHQMRGFAGSCRFVFNRALALQQEIYWLWRALRRDGSMEKRTRDVLVEGRTIAGAATVTEESRRWVAPTL